MSKKTLEIVKNTGNDAVLQVKDNQKYLLLDCQKIAKQEPDEIFIQSDKKERNRKETRITKTFTDLCFIHKDKWNLVEIVIQVERQRKDFNTKTKAWEEKHEIAYYIATKKLTAQEAGKIIRDHWGIENKNHYVKDVSMREDASRIRKNPHMIAKLRSTALNILKADGTKNTSNQLYENCLDINDFMKKYKDFIK